jgi:hypothetical protein
MRLLLSTIALTLLVAWDDSSDLTADYLACEEAVARLVDCCPNLKAEDFVCNSGGPGSDNGCKKTSYIPDFSRATADCIESASCEALVAAGGCATPSAFPESIQTTDLGPPAGMCGSVSGTDAYPWDGGLLGDGGMPLECSAPDGPLHLVSTPAELATLATGVWIKCKSGATFFDWPVGVDLSCDGKWYALEQTGDGKLVRATGFESIGTWQAQDPSLSIQVPPNIYFTSEAPFATAAPSVSFVDNPLKMRLNDDVFLKVTSVQ